MCTQAFCLALVWLASGAQAESSSWTRIGDDLELSRFNLQPLSLFSPEIVAVRTSLRKYKIGVVRAQDFGEEGSDARSLCRQSRALVCLNANFFDQQGKVLGLVVSRGIMLHPLHTGGKTLTGLIGVNHDQVQITHRGAYTPGKYLEALQAGPRLLARGSLIKVEANESSRRSGVCIDSSRRVVLYSVTSTFSFGGVTIPELQRILRSESFDCVDALNFDGGGSAQFYVSKSLPGAASTSSELFLPGRDNVPVMLGLFLK